MKKLKILILVKRFADNNPKHKHLFDMITAIEQFAEVRYWHSNGEISAILKKLKFKPDFIYHFDIAWGYGLAPKIIGLDKINIPKGCHVCDVHYHKKNRINYINNNNIDLIFSYTKNPFLKVYPEYRNKHRWLPFSVNASIVKDWKLNKDIEFLLMGQFYYTDYKQKPKRLPPKGRYSFREAVYNKMKKQNGFVFIPHPGHHPSPSPNLMVNENYARTLNRSNIFFTCGGILECPVAKFFEALGCRTLLLAKPNKDILELGFEDGVNFVACNETNFYKKAMYYKKNINARKKIIDNGYNFIHTHHTNQVRARQFINYIQDFLQKN